jgi:site-specific DNA-cytosine methylase
MKRYRVGNGFGGMGGGALGFAMATESLFGTSASFELAGAVDFDQYACDVYQMFTGAAETCLDVETMTVEDMRRVYGETAPDVMCSSPPCQGSSKLLASAKALLPKYEQMNKLAIKWTRLILATWPDAPPRLLVYENVPAITTRARSTLAEVRKVLRGDGGPVRYATQDGYHDCGEVGGLAQHRRRWFMVCRLERCEKHPDRVVPAFLYKPPKKRVRGCGEELEKLPLPNDPIAGPMHQLPNVAAVQWFRLAAIPAGGDHRDLKHVLEGAPRRSKFRRHHVEKWTDPSITVAGTGSNGPVGVADPRPGSFADVGPRKGGFTNIDHVTGWEDPSRAVTGATRPGQGAPSVGDPRIATPKSWDAGWGVRPWTEPLGAVTGHAGHSTGAFSVADPRFPLVPQPNNEGMHYGKYVVRRWVDPAKTITGATRIGSGAQSVADPGRIDASGFRGAWGVLGWEEPSGAVTGNARHATGTFSIADPRTAIAVTGAYDHGYAVLDWREPSATIAGHTAPGCGAYSVADGRPPIGLHCTPRAGAYGVLPWAEASKVITGVANIDNGPFAVADPRFPDAPPVAIVERWDRPPFRLEVTTTKSGKEKVRRVPVPLVILSEDGTWHRPLTTLELLALQGFPTKLHGKYVVMPGGTTVQRQAVGNAIPPPAARAIAEQMILALVASDMGCFYLDKGGAGVWVQREEFEAELRRQGIERVDERKPWKLGGMKVLDDGAVVTKKRTAKKKAGRAMPTPIHTRRRTSTVTLHA